jgi:putative effector of murein hydrolase LrgA (UPF0299 family)
MSGDAAQAPSTLPAPLLGVILLTLGFLPRGSSSSEELSTQLRCFLLPLLLLLLPGYVRPAADGVYPFAFTALLLLLLA